MLTYDLRKERRTVGHLTRDGQFTSLSQRTDSEQELVTCDAQVGVTLTTLMRLVEGLGRWRREEVVESTRGAKCCFPFST